MKKIKIRAAVLALFTALTLGLGACAPQRGEKAAVDRSSAYSTSEDWQAVLSTEAPLREPVYVSGIYEFDRAMYIPFEVTASPEGLYLRVTAVEKGDCVWEFDSQGRFIREYQTSRPGWIGRDGSVWNFESVETKDNAASQYIDYSLTRSRDGQLSQVLSFRQEQGTADFFLAGEGFCLYKMYWDENNQGHFSLEIYGDDGDIRRTIELDAWYQALEDRGELYLLNRDTGDIFRVDTESLSLVKADVMDADCLSCSVQNGQLYESDGFSLFRRKLGESWREKLFSYEDLGLINIRDRLPVPIGGTEAFLFIDYLNEVSPYRLIYPVEKSSLPAERKQIILAVNIPEENWEYEPYGLWRNEILDFNAVSLDYEVVIRNYGLEPDPQTALNVDLSSGKAPDLIDMSISSYEDGSARETWQEITAKSFEMGFINEANCEDLLPWFERDFGTENLLAGPLETMEQNGRLLSLIPSFSICSILGPGSILEGQDLNSFSDLARLAGRAENVFWAGVSREEFLYYAFANSRRDYSPEQISDILYQAAVLNSAYDSDPTLKPWYYEEGSPGRDAWLLDMGDVWYGSQCFTLQKLSSPLWSTAEDTEGMATVEGIFREPISIIGQPGLDGFYLIPERELVMPVNAENKSGAWEFMKFVLNERYLLQLNFDGFFRCGIPLTRSAYERGMEACREKAKGSIQQEDIVLNYDPANCLSQFEQLVNSVNGICRGGDGVFTAIIQSAGAYFSGVRNLEQTSADIAARLSIYNAEQA